MKKARLALFFGGKISQHLVLVKNAAKKLGVKMDLISYNRVSFETETGKVILRKANVKIASTDKLEDKKVSDYDVLFFRTTGKHWEEVNLILDSVKEEVVSGKIVVVDPLILKGRPADACKAYQMLELGRAGIDVPKTIYGSLWYLYETMKIPKTKDQRPNFDFPVIIKGSGGDRGTRVYKADSIEEMGKLVTELRKSETEEGKRYMLQEFIPNDGDFRVLVLGKKVLGVMKRSSEPTSGEFRNNYSMGGKVEVAELPEEIKRLAVKAAEVCGLWVAGVDVVFRNNDINKPVIWEVNKGPQFKGFMKATGIDVPAEIVKFLVSLKKLT